MKDVAASVRARLTNISQAENQPLQRVLQRYINERILYRIASSEHQDSFVLKGATLFVLWLGRPHRATKDLDLLGLGQTTEEELRALFVALLGRPVEPPDGVDFDTAGLKVAAIREDQRYGGLRITTRAFLGAARLPVQIDVGFGDAAEPEWAAVDSLLQLPSPRVRAYTRDQVVAEKLDAMVQLGEFNSRMKDFFDLRFLADRFSFSGATLSRTIEATFNRRQTDFPRSGLDTLFEGLRSLPQKKDQWAGFLRKAETSLEWSFEETLTVVKPFLEAPLLAAATSSPFSKSWSPGGPWRQEREPK